MQRYFVEPEAIQNGAVTITGDDVKHIVRVLRMEAGEQVIVCDGVGHAYLVELTELGGEQVVGRIMEQLADTAEPRVKITLAQGLPKGDKMDLIVQKGTEVGISRFVPLEMARCIVQYDQKKEQKRRERWQKIAKEAAEQAHRTLIPSVGIGMTLKQLVGNLDGFDLVLVPYEGEKARGLREVLQEHPDVGHICVVIGPEGGISEAEIETALAAGAIPVTLGPRILRTETAGLVTAACICYQVGEMGG
ncbi:16S rRNA (uracil(1498)-N(3))-methyltransferase [Tumebacillus algifaecis]|uniref:Ribosomal RNA small subunit methyltransferase E n=1 Tax=Tumebacillus algifaecis TaxID=1214604 RepID=A0A223D372_9BACL|nr:16S rRNA (uracil(1498)-N(3))-methyltransferase [Tumebacillus algifaecis]ASS76098.1 16S rRNA (uracil(1498)-N(3))-methyltransferase [Tumebacillus algifaecis]